MLAQSIMPPWGWYTALYYWLASVASFMFAAAFLGSLVRYEHAWAVRWSIRLAGPVAILALLTEALELGNPGTLYWIFSNLSSPIAINAATASVFIVFSLAYAFLPWRSTAPQRYVMGALGWIATAAAVIWLVGRIDLLISAATRPFWAAASTPALLLISSVMVGLGALVFISGLGALARKGGALNNVMRLSSIVAACILALAFVLGTQIAGALEGEETLTRSAAMLIYGASSGAFWMAAMVGFVVPGIIYVIQYVFKGLMSDNARYIALALASALVIVGILILYGAIISVGLRAPIPGEV